MKLEEIKNKTKEATDYLVQSLEAGHSEVLTQYLGAMGRFHTYSFGNVMLIARQKPSATNVAGVRAWNSLGRFVRRGEKGILILAPLVGRKVKTVEEITGEKGEEKNPQAQLYGFRAVYVFDRLSRDLWPSLCALDCNQPVPLLESPLDSSRHIIAQVLCPAQRFLMQGFQLSASFVHQSGF